MRAHALIYLLFNKPHVYYSLPIARDMGTIGAISWLYFAITSKLLNR